MTTYDWNTLMQQAGTAMEPLPPAEYDVQITSAEATTSSTSKLMIKARMQVVAGPHSGRPIWNNFTLSPENPQALGFFFQHMKILGLDSSFFQGNPAPESVAEALKGRTCRVKLGVRTYQGSPRNNVERVMPSQFAGGPAPAMGGLPGLPSMPPGMPPGMPAPAAAPVPPAAPAPAPMPPGIPQPPMAPGAPAPAPVPTAPPAAPMPPAPPQPPAAPAPMAPPQPPAAPVAPTPPPAPVAPVPQPPQPMPPAPPVEAPAPPPPPPAPAPEPQYYTDPATGQRWDGAQWLPPVTSETQSLPSMPPAPPVPQAPAAPQMPTPPGAPGIPNPPF